LLPIAERFWSIQGEGFHTGVPMIFIRLAGCNVGEYLKSGEDPSNDTQIKPGDLNLLYSHKHSICTAADGQKFLCDTDYHATEKMSLREAIKGFSETHHICITGGEPLMHPTLMEELLNMQEGWYEAAKDSRFSLQVHIETSGTKSLENLFKLEEAINLWITCSPKKGFLRENVPYINEFKILCGPEFRPQVFEELIGDGSGDLFYLQPIQGINETDDAAFARCLEILKYRPQWTLSSQLHKFLKLR
jgi:7-carboxy-7-deazaguanine synthase